MLLLGRQAASTYFFSICGVLSVLPSSTRISWIGFGVIWLVCCRWRLEAFFRRFNADTNSDYALIAILKKWRFGFVV